MRGQANACRVYETFVHVLNKYFSKDSYSSVNSKNAKLGIEI